MPVLPPSRPIYCRNFQQWWKCSWNLLTVGASVTQCTLHKTLPDTTVRPQWGSPWPVSCSVCRDCTLWPAPLTPCCLSLCLLSLLMVQENRGALVWVCSFWAWIPSREIPTQSHSHGGCPCGFVPVLWRRKSNRWAWQAFLLFCT